MKKTKFKGIHWSKMPNKEEIKQKISQSKIGKPSNYKGKHHSEKTKKILSEKFKIIAKEKGFGRWMKGKKLSEETKRKIGLSSLGKKHTQEAKIKMSKALKGRVFTDKWKQKMKDTWAKNRKNRLGKNHWNWQGGVAFLASHIKNSFLYRQWRSDIFTRDNFTCQNCGARGGKIEAHHTKQFAKIMNDYKITNFEDAMKCEELWNINNGQTLCKKCHDKTKKGGKRLS